MKTQTVRKIEKVTISTFFGLLINVLYGIGNTILGIVTNSWWCITLSAYYITISVMRVAILFYIKKSKIKNFKNEIFVKKFTGFMFFLLAVILIETTILAVKQETGTVRHEIIIITIATYTFTKITLAVINLLRSRKYKSQVITTIRNIAFADAAVSVFSLQRSMLVSFGNMQSSDIRIFNILTGSGVCLFVILLGANLIRKD